MNVPGALPTPPPSKPDPRPIATGALNRLAASLNRDAASTDRVALAVERLADEQRTANLIAWATAMAVEGGSADLSVIYDVVTKRLEIDA